MTWVRLDDQWADHPKFLKVGDLGKLAWVVGLTYAARYLTDGHLPDEVIPRFLSSAKASLNACAKLVAAGLWERVEDGYTIHDYHEYQPLASSVKAQREATRQRVSRFRNGVTPSVTPTVTNGVTHALVTSESLARARSGAGRAHSGSDLPTEIQTVTVTARAPMSPEAVAIADELEKHPRLLAGLEHEITRIADEHAGYMFAKNQRLAWVLASIDACAAKTMSDEMPAVRMRAVVAYMRHAKPPRGDEGKPATAVAKSVESTPEQTEMLRRAQEEKQANAEQARKHKESLQANGAKR